MWRFGREGIDRDESRYCNAACSIWSMTAKSLADGCKVVALECGGSLEWLFYGWSEKMRGVQRFALPGV